MTSEAQDVLRTDYGRFNPRFIGLTYLFDSPDDYNHVLSSMTDAPAPPNENPTISDLHRISILSVVDHENRHYIDFLLSPYSMTVFRMRMQALINGMQAVTAMRALAGDVVPVPLSRWATLDGPARSERQAEWSDLLGRQALPIGLPLWSSDDLLSNLPPTIERVDGQDEAADAVRYVEASIRAYLRIEQLTRGMDASIPERYFRTPNVHEASALTAQLGAVWVGQGELEFVQLMEFLLNSQAPQTRMWQTCYQLATLIEQSGLTSTWTEEQLLRSVRRMLTITTWSLLGNYQLDGVRASAAHRLYELLKLVAADPTDTRWSCDMDDADSIRRMWDYWDRRTGVARWANSLADNVSMTKRGPATYKEVLRNWEGSTEILESVIAVAEQVTTDQDVVVATFLGDLATVVDPFRLATADPEAFPHPDFRLEFQGFGVKPAGIAAGRPMLRRAASGESYVSGVAFSVAGDAKGQEILDRKLELEQVIEWCDVLFSDLPVPDHVAVSARVRLAELTGRRLLQLV